MIAYSIFLQHLSLIVGHCSKIWALTHLVSYLLALGFLIGFTLNTHASEKEYVLQLWVLPETSPPYRDYLKPQTLIGSWKVGEENVFQDEDYEDLCMTIRTGFTQEKAKLYHKAKLQKALIFSKNYLRDTNDKPAAVRKFFELAKEIEEKALKDINNYWYKIKCVSLQDIVSLNTILDKPR